MRKTMLFILLLINSYSYSQELMNIYIEPNGTNIVDLHTLVYNNTLSSFSTFNVSTTDNTITITLCYLNSSAATETYDPQINEVNLPAGYSNYTIYIELYGDNDAVTPCSLENLVDTGTITFGYPINQTELTYIPDNGFENYLENLGFGDDVVNNDYVFTHRIINMTNLFLNNYPNPISSMEGLQDFKALRDLRCGGSQHNISSLDVSNNINLEWLWCYSNPLSELDLSNNINLTRLNCSYTDITNLDLTNNLSLEWLEINNNAINSIDLSQNNNLFYLNIESNIFDSIDLSNLNLLTYFYCSNNLLTFINLSENSNLERLYCNSNQLASLNTNTLTQIEIIEANYNQLETIDLSLNTNLEKVWFFFNYLTSLNLKNGNNANITDLILLGNDNLYCIEVDNPDEAPYPGWNVDGQVVFSEDCSLGTTEQRLQEAIQLYPNPVKNTLQISTENSIAIKSIQVFDVLGKKVLARQNTNQIDVSALATGLLFVKITTDKGVVVKKVVKE